MELVIKLSQNGWEFSLTELRKLMTKEALSELRASLRLTTYVRRGRKVIEINRDLYRIVGDSLCIPRFYPLNKIVARAKTEVRLRGVNTIPCGESINIDGSVTLTKDQQTVFDHLVANVYSERNVRNGKASCILVMDTGMGKTFIAGALIKRFLVKTLVVVPNDIIRDGWVKMLENLDVNPDNGSITILMIQSAYKTEINGQHYSTFFSKFGMLILDEVHSYASEEFSKIFWHANCRYALFMTATPDERSDKMDQIYYHHGGPIIKATDIRGFSPDVIEWKGIVEQVHYTGHPSHVKHIPGPLGTDTQATIRQIEADPYRNKLILQLVSDAGDANLLIFAEHVDYLQTLGAQIPGAIVMTGGADIDTRNAARSAKVVLVTYGYGIEGMSLSHMTTAIFATPRRSKTKQLIGRILRRDGDLEKIRVIYDIIDTEINLASQSTSRRSAYRDRNFTITKRKVLWSDFKPKNENDNDM